MTKTDLDVDSPEKVIQVLRTTSQMYFDSASELQSAWQDKSAGKDWVMIGRILDTAADQIEKRLR